MSGTKSHAEHPSSSQPLPSERASQTGTIPPADAEYKQDSASSGARAPIAAYIHGQPISWDQLHAPLIEAGGAEVLEELILDKLISRRLSQRSLSVAPQQIADERRRLLQSLNSNPDVAQRLLMQMRLRRGLGEDRFNRMLSRAAVLRTLVQDDVQVSQAAVRQEFELTYGPKDEVRVLVCDSFPLAADLVKRARAGEPFTDLVAAHSVHSSRDQGGLLPPFSLADPTYPAAVRSVVGQLAPGQVSDPVALESGVAILKLERKIDGRNAQFDDVKGILEQRVRQRAEELLMRQLSQALMSEAEVTILDPALKKAWDERQAELSKQQ